MKLNNLIIISSFFIIVLSACSKEKSLDTGTGTGSGTSASARPKTYSEDVTDDNGHFAVTFNIT